MRRPEVGIIALAMLVSACAYPTESPNWDVTWNLPLPDNNQSIAVTTFLPTGVDTVTPAPGSPLAFRVQVSGTPSINRTLGVQCPTCPSGTAPKPSFTAPLASTTITLASGTGLSAAALSPGSQLALTLNNGFSFDPINPPGGSPGTITIAVNNGSATLGTLTLVGGATTLPPGQARTFNIQIAGTINTASPITVSMSMDSPAGAADQPVSLNPNHPFTATTVPTLNVSSATVSVPAKAIPPSTDTTDFDVPDEVINRISDDAQNRAILFMTVTNPFTLGASATITFRSPAGAEQIVPITKNISITAAANASTPNVSTIQVALTGQEIRRMAGRELEVVFGGTTAAGTLTVTPTQAITFTQRIQLTLNIKEQTP